VEHLEELDAEISEYLGREPKPYRMSGEFKRDRRQYVVVGEILQPINDVRWGVMLGDAVHNLRSALDHLIWQLVLLNTGKKGSRENKFPIESDGRRYWSITKDGNPSVRDRALKNVADEHRLLIDELQPYRTNQGHPVTVLDTLRDFSNFDKHRLLNPVLFAIDAVGKDALRMLTNDDAGDQVGIEINFFSPHGEAEVLVMDYSCPGENPHVSMDGEPAIGIGFGEARIRFSQLPRLGEWVGEILDRFSPDFP
jgi:hypothetical protein